MRRQKPLTVKIPPADMKAGNILKYIIKYVAEPLIIKFK